MGRVGIVGCCIPTVAILESPDESPACWHQSPGCHPASGLDPVAVNATLRGMGRSCSSHCWGSFHGRPFHLLRSRSTPGLAVAAAAVVAVVAAAVAVGAAAAVVAAAAVAASATVASAAAVAAAEPVVAAAAFAAAAGSAAAAVRHRHSCWTAETQTWGVTRQRVTGRGAWKQGLGSLTDPEPWRSCLQPLRRTGC